MEWGDFRSKEGSFFVVGFVPIEDEIGRERGGGGGRVFCCDVANRVLQGREVFSFPPSPPPPLPPGIILREYRSVGLPPPPFVACCRHISISRPRLSESSFGADLAFVFFVFEKECGIRKRLARERTQWEDSCWGVFRGGAPPPPPPPGLFSSPTKTTAPFLVRVPSKTPKHNRKCTKNSRGTAYRSWRPPIRTRPSPIPSSPNSTRRAITATTKRVR